MNFKKRPRWASAKISRGFAQVVIKANQCGRHGDHHEGQAQDCMRDDQSNMRGDQVEAVTRLELDLAFGKTLDADLRARQVGQDAHFHAHAGGSGTHIGGALGLAGRVTVAEVEANHVHAGAEEILQHARRVGGRSEGGEDLGATLTLNHG